MLHAACVQPMQASHAWLPVFPSQSGRLAHISLGRSGMPGLPLTLSVIPRPIRQQEHAVRVVQVVRLATRPVRVVHWGGVGPLEATFAVHIVEPDPDVVVGADERLQEGVLGGRVDRGEVGLARDGVGAAHHGVVVVDFVVEETVAAGLVQGPAAGADGLAERDRRQGGE